MSKFRKTEKTSALCDLVVLTAGGFDWHQNRKAMFAFAARKSGLSIRTIQGIFYGEYSEDDAAVRLLRMRAELIEERRRSAVLAHRCAQIAHTMEAADADFYSDNVALFRRMAAQARKKESDELANGHGDQSGAGTNQD